MAVVVNSHCALGAAWNTMIYQASAIDRVVAAVDGSSLLLSSCYDDDGDPSTMTKPALIKFDPQGALQWVKAFTSNQVIYEMSLNDVAQLSDGTYFLTGYVPSGTGNNPPPLPNVLGWPWVARLDPSGNILWQRMLYGSAIEGYKYGMFTVVKDAGNGAVLLAGRVENQSQTFPWAMKINAQGAIEWQTSFHSTLLYNARIADLARTSDGGCVAALIYGNASPNYDTGVLKITAGGGFGWARKFASPSQDHLSTIDVTPDGSIVLAGYQCGVDSLGSIGLWVVKVSSAGKLSWQKAFCKVAKTPVFTESMGLAVKAIADNGCLIAGRTSGFPTDNSDPPGGFLNALLLKLTSRGSIVSQQVFGYNSGSHDWFLGLAATPDGGLLLGGVDQDPDYYGLVVKTDSTLSLPCREDSSFKTVTNLATATTITMTSLTTGSTLEEYYAQPVDQSFTEAPPVCDVLIP